MEDIFLIVVEVATDADQVPPLEFDNRYLDASQSPEFLLDRSVVSFGKPNGSHHRIPLGRIGDQGGGFQKVQKCLSGELR